MMRTRYFGGFTVGWLLALAWLASLAVYAAAKAEPVTANGRVTQVTLYRGQALVTRTVPVDAPPGLDERYATLPAAPPVVVPVVPFP